jgi:predicted RNA methylase
LNDIPSGEVVELAVGGGRIALAARQADDRWVLLQGSDVRVEAVASANASTTVLRLRIIFFFRFFG